MKNRALKLLVAVLVFSNFPARTQPLDPAQSRAFGGIQPTISPDGKAIALSFQGAICRLPSDGGVLTRLTRAEGWDIEPAWSPDGKSIAFVNAPGFRAGPLRMIAAENGAVVNLPKEVLARGRLQFHPDGKRIFGVFGQTGQPERLQWFDLTSGELSPIDIALLDSHQRASMKWALAPDGSSILLATFQDRVDEQTGNNGPS